MKSVIQKWRILQCILFFSCFSCRWLVNLIMHGLTYGTAVISAGWVCWLTFEENTDNVMVQALLGRGVLEISLAEVRTGHLGTAAAPGTWAQLPCLYSTGQICARWASGKNRASGKSVFLDGCCKLSNWVTWLKLEASPTEHCPVSMRVCKSEKFRSQV